MYGTVFRIRAKPGGGEALWRHQSELIESARMPGLVGVLIYQMDSDPEEYLVAVVYQDRESYLANSDSPEQDARYQELRALLAGDPEWNDGEIVYQNLLATAAM